MIKVENLTKDYGFGRGVFDISFEVEEGEIYGFLGPNGAGKTTTMRMLMGFSQPDSGEASIDGKNCWCETSSILEDIGYLPGEISLPDGLNGLEFIEMMKKLKNADDKRINYLIDLFELNPNQNTKRMSIGDKRKLAIVAAFMSDSKILILDEPTSGLDPLMQSKFIELINAEKKRGKTILLSTHIFQEVDNSCDRLSIIKDGKISTTIETSKFRNNENKVFQVEFLFDEDFEKFLKSDLDIIYNNEKKMKIKIAINDSEINDFINIISKYKIKYFSETKYTLEDYFLSYYSGREDAQ